MALIIPLNRLPADAITVNINNVPYLLRNRWNSRDESWHLDINEQDGTPIITSLKLVSNSVLTAKYVDERLPKDGFFICLDNTGLQTRPSFDDLGERIKLVYARASELT